MWGDHVRWLHARVIVRINNTKMTKCQLRKSDIVKNKLIIRSKNVDINW